MFPVGQTGPGPVGPPALNQVSALDLHLFLAFVNYFSFLNFIMSKYFWSSILLKSLITEVYNVESWKQQLMMIIDLDIWVIFHVIF